MHDPTPLTDRIRWLRCFRDKLRAHHRELAMLASGEVGKSEFEAIVADVLPLIASCNWHLRCAARLLRPTRVGAGGLFGLGHSVERRRLPVGRVLVIATWNYPVQLLGIQLVQAVLAGNSVVVKPSERAPRTQERLLSLAMEATDIITSMRGAIDVRPATREEGRRLLEEENFDHVVFTGSTAVGRAIAAACAARLIPSTLELSGSDSAIVFADADVRASARAVYWGFTSNAGQTCMAPRRALVAREVCAAFVAELERLLKTAGPVTLIDEHAATTVINAVNEAVREGGRSLSMIDFPHAQCQRRSVRPTAVMDCPVDSDLFLGRHFGPALAIRTFTSTDEAFALHARAQHYLATSLWTRQPNVELAARVQACGSSLVHYNAVLLPSAHPAIAISGSGASGWGSSRGEAGLLSLTREAFVTRTRSFLQPPLNEPSLKVQSLLSRLIAWPNSARQCPPKDTAVSSKEP